MTQTLLIVDDERDIVEALARVLGSMEDVKVLTAHSGEEALEVCRNHHPAAVLSDLRMPGMDGLELLLRVKELNDAIQFVLITGHGTIDQAVQAMKRGAYDFLQKPFRKQDIIAVVHRVLEKAALLDENRRLKEKLRGRSLRKYEFGTSEIFRNLLQRATQAAASEATILILGESGTGKEVLANFIYDHSQRCDGPLVKVNCAAIPENLLEAELFGYKKGAFTGAYADKKGKFHEAHKGTIFLDEIGELPMSIQSKLLRVLQEGEISPVGGRVEKVDVRIVAATNRNLKELIKEGRFREDLYYRLNVIPLMLPSLREHMEDLPALVGHFIAKHCERNHREHPSVSKQAFRLMEAYHWPGNIRELENTIERAIIFCLGNQITESDLPEELTAVSVGTLDLSLAKGMTLEEIENQVILLGLQKHRGDKKKVADELGISLRTIYRKLEVLGL
jgi:two-component system response regulator HydG